MCVVLLLIVLVVVVVFGVVFGFGVIFGLIVMCIGLGVWILFFGNKKEYFESGNFELLCCDLELEIDVDVELV